MKIRAKSFQGIASALLAPPMHRIYDSKWQVTLTSRVLQPRMSWSAALLDVGLWLPYAYTMREMWTAVSWAFATCQVLHLASNITWFSFFSPSLSFLSTFPVPFSLLDWNEQQRPLNRRKAIIQSCAVCLVTQSCSILCNPVDCSPPGSSVHGILQARILQ